MDPKDHLEKLQEQIDLIIGTKSTLKRRKKNADDVQREIFINTIPLIEHISLRGSMLHDDYGIDIVKFEDPYFQIIDSLIYLNFGEEASELIMFYIYDRKNIDGTINDLVDKDGNIVTLNNAGDLWELIKKLKK
jgi:hypothetical protein